jgi:hypothetical protein
MIPKVFEHPMEASCAVVPQDFTNVPLLWQHPVIAKPKSTSLSAIYPNDEVLVLQSNPTRCGGHLGVKLGIPN